MRVSKEFFVDKYDVENMSCFTVSVHPVPMRDRTQKITITYEVDCEITIKESDIDKIFSDKRIGFTESDIELIKQKLFGDK